MFTAAAQVASVERRVTAYSEAGQGTDSSQPSFRVSEPCIPVRSGRPSLTSSVAPSDGVRQCRACSYSSPRRASIR